MAEKRQKKQAAKAFEKETFSKDKEVTGVKHIEHRQDNTFSVENQFSASEKPVSNLPRDANHGSRTGKATSGHSVQKSEFNTGTEYRKNNKKKYYRQQQQDTSGHSVQKSEAEAEKTFLKENSFINEENGNATNFHTEDADSFQDNYHVRNTYQRSEEKGKYHKRRVQREHAHRERAKSENAKQSDYGDLQTKDATFSQGQADEFTDQKVQKAFDKSEKNRRKLQKAKDKMPTKRQYEMKRVFDEQTGKAKYVVVPVDVEKPFKPDGLGKTAVHKLQTENMYFVHRKIAETEKDNSAVEGAHKTEQRAEDIYHYMKYHRKSKAQRKRDRLERLHKKQVTADMKLEYEKFISENPHLKGNSPKKQLQRQLQKQRIKREYAKARRVGAEAKTAKETFTKTANAATGIAKKLQEIATKNKTLIITVGIFALLLIMIMSALSSCGSMFTGTVTTTMASTYLSLPAEIDAADLSFTEKEMELQNKIDRIETDYPGYDEYDYNLGAIGHDPYTLISYLSAVHTEFTAAGIESEIQELFDAMYSLTTEEVEETRTRTVTKTGTRIVTNPDGTTRTEEYEYEEEEEWEDEQADIVSGKRIDVDFLNYIPELRDTPKVQDAIKKLIAAYPEKDVIDMETKEQKIQTLAAELDQLSYEIDTYGYRDSVSDRESQIQMIADDIRTGNVKPLSIFLQASIDEGIDEDSERQAKELLVKLAEYKPLAKIEELEEQNYNMIDERLNNGVEKFNREEEKKEQQEKPQARSSLKERLAAKQKEATQGNNKDTKEQEKSKNSHREM